MIEFNKNNHDFGEIKGEIAETEFMFTNVGKSNLIISDASGSCGCTVPDYPKEILNKTWESGKIVVKFDSNNRPDCKEKAVTLITNTAKGNKCFKYKIDCYSKIINYGFNTTNIIYRCTFFLMILGPIR